METRNKLWLIALSVLVGISLLVNGFLMMRVLQARDAALEAVVMARDNLAVLSAESVIVPVRVDQEIPFDTVIPIDQTFSVPLDFEYTLSTVVNTWVNIPVLGRQNVSIPVDTVVPVSYTLEIPIRVDFPISLTYHLQTEIPVAVDIPLEIRASLDTVLSQIEDGLR